MEKGNHALKKKIHTHNMKYEFDPVRRPMLMASKIWILGSFPITEKVLKETVTSKFSSMIWYCPIKYNHLHIKSLCLHQKHSGLATELLRVQRGLNSQGEGKAGAISNLVISDLDSHTNAGNITLENCTL